MTGILTSVMVKFRKKDNSFSHQQGFRQPFLASRLQVIHSLVFMCWCFYRCYGRSVVTATSNGRHVHLTTAMCSPKKCYKKPNKSCEYWTRTSTLTKNCSNWSTRGRSCGMRKLLSRILRVVDGVRTLAMISERSWTDMRWILMFIWHPMTRILCH